MPEARLQRTDTGLVPQGEGWFVLNARESRWAEGVFGAFTRFEGEGEARFPQLGVNVSVLEPGQPACMYHAEGDQEGFLVLTGECLLLVEGEERPLRAWDYFHCAPQTEHVLVGAGTGPCHILSIGRRAGGGVVYSAAEFAQRHEASVEETTNDPREAYARYAADADAPYREGRLPG